MPEMKIYKALLNITPLFLISAFICTSCSSRQDYKTIDGFTQGTTYHIVYQQPGADSLNAMIDSILLAVDNSLSVYNDSSLISRINRNEEVLADTLFVNVFNRSREIWELSKGSFDISAAPYFEVWGFGAGEKRDVTQLMIDSIRQFVGMDKVSLDSGRVVKSDPRVSLNVNAIAQGYTADVIAYAFDRLGIKNYLVEVGGEIFSRGVNARGNEWTVGLDKPVEGNMIQGEELQEIITLSGRGLATSGNYRKFIEENGQKYSHTIDPGTGYPVKQSLLSATVIAPDAMTADAYATWFMVVGLEKAKEVLAASPGIDAYLVYDKDGKFEVFYTDGIKIK